MQEKIYLSIRPADPETGRETGKSSLLCIDRAELPGDLQAGDLVELDIHGETGSFVVLGIEPAPEIPAPVTITIDPEEGEGDCYFSLPVESVPEDLQPGDRLEIKIGGEDFSGEVLAITWPPAKQ